MTAVIMADDERRSSLHSAPLSGWGKSQQPIYPRSHHGTPAQEYSNFTFDGGAAHHYPQHQYQQHQQLPMEPSSFQPSVQHQRMAHPQLQPLIMPQWPSMLSSQSHPGTASSYMPLVAPPVQQVQPQSAGPLHTPVSATSTKSGSTPRKTLTDSDRRRMCQYAEEHPAMKQTDIGLIFGVERSTVSKVLRQKDKYLIPDEGRRSPIKRVKGKSPDIERTLAVWATKQARRGLPLTDDLIREKARAFSSTALNPENHYTTSSNWIGKFKLRHNLMGARSRKGSLAPDDSEGMSTAPSSTQTPSGTSPVSPVLSPQPLHSAESLESLKQEDPDDYDDFNARLAAFHTQSSTSLNSAFNDTAPSSFSPLPLSPTSPFFTPDSGTAPGPFIPLPPLTARHIPPTTMSPNAPRPRSQTFPLLIDQYLSMADMPTPKYAPAAMLDSPMEESPDPLGSLNANLTSMSSEERLIPQTVSPSDTMGPPPLPPHILEMRGDLTPAVSTSSASSAASYMHPVATPEDARRALEFVISFLHTQPDGFVSLEEGMTMANVMNKLTLRARSES